MEITLTQISALTPLCPESVESRATAHPVKVGLSAVYGTSVSGAWQGVVRDQHAVGGAHNARPRTNELTINVQQALGVYGDPSFIRTSVTAAKGSLMAKPLAPATAKASGVPPRGRPV